MKTQNLIWIRTRNL